MRALRDFVIYCDRASDTAGELSRRLNARRLYSHPTHKLRSLAGSLCINYGTGHSPNFGLGVKSIILNSPEAVSRAISKRVSYESFSRNQIPTLDFSTERDTALAWAKKGSGVLCRRDGLSGGKGISFVPKGSGDVPKADFYTRYFAKSHEYRAHVVKDRLIDLTQKRLQNGAAKGDDSETVVRIVRSLENGWIHAHGFECSQKLKKDLEDVAVRAVRALGLDFGAVDILVKVNSKHPSEPPQLAVCEINTAPGLANEVTLKAYVDAFSNQYISTSSVRAVAVPRRKRRVQKQVLVWITTRKDNRVQRERMRTFYE